MCIHIITGNRPVDHTRDAVCWENRPVIGFMIDMPGEQPAAYTVIDEVTGFVVNTFAVIRSAALARSAAHALAEKLGSDYFVKTVWEK